MMDSTYTSETTPVHPSFGDLSDSNAVLMPVSSLVNDSFKELRPYYVHLSVTGRCNARCAGCVNSDVTFRHSDRQWMSSSNDTNAERDAKAILKLTQHLNEKEIVVSFYGGEPLLLPEKILKVISILSTSTHPSEFKYMIYTNGQLLGNVIKNYPALIPEIWLWSVSIDGTHQQHNRIRAGTDLEEIHNHLSRLKSIKTGPVLMWSTLREEQSLADCFHEFLYLHERDEVDLFFWHWVETDSPFSNLASYLERYERDLKQIMDTYVTWLTQGKLLPIVHINELILYLLTGKQRGTSACAVELARNFDIMGGKVHPCADLPPEHAIGSISDDGNPDIEPAELSSLIDYKKDLGCYQCGVHAYCGGRCPVQALTGTKTRLEEYCQLMRLHVGTVQRYMPEINRYVGKGAITLQEIYDRSAFYTQFTDVTP